ETALRAENVELPAGRIESQTRDFTLRVARGYTSPQDFAAVPLRKGADGYVVRLGDVAQVELASAERRAYYYSNGQPNIGLGIVKTSTANALDVTRAARAMAVEIQKSLPEGTHIFVAFDDTVFIEASIERVYATLIEAVLLVLAVIWLFLGSFRAALIPAVTVPVCLLAAFIPLYLFDYSINLLTLLALVLSIGLVVDDAIVVLENIQRRVDLGEPKLVAAVRGTRQVAFAVIARTTVLVAVFLPVGFMEGNTGRLFRELSVALAGAVALSAFVALTLTPMMASKLVRPHRQEKSNPVNRGFNRLLDRVAGSYRRMLARLVGVRPGGIVAGVALTMLACLAATWALARFVPSELAPAEDRGAFFVSIVGPEGAGFDYTVKQIKQVESIFAERVKGDDAVIERYNTRAPGGWGASEEMHTGNVIVFLKDWRERDQSTAQVADSLRQDLGTLSGVEAQPRVGGGLVGSRGQPIQIVLGGPEYAEIAQWRDIMMERMEANPGFFSVDSDYKETRPQMRVQIDRARASD